VESQERKIEGEGEPEAVRQTQMRCNLSDEIGGTPKIILGEGPKTNGGGGRKTSMHREKSKERESQKKGGRRRAVQLPAPRQHKVYKDRKKAWHPNLERRELKTRAILKTTKRKKREGM